MTKASWSGWSVYTLRLPVPHEQHLDWLEKHGQQLKFPLPDPLPPIPGKVYVRYSKTANYQTQMYMAVYVDLDPTILSHSTFTRNWVWFSVPKLLVLPYTNAPLF